MIQINALMLANDTEIVIGILIREDAIIEDTESFVASLQVSPGTFPGNNTNATVYILDNDGELLFFYVQCVHIPSIINLSST